MGSFDVYSYYNTRIICLYKSVTRLVFICPICTHTKFITVKQYSSNLSARDNSREPCTVPTDTPVLSKL